MAAADAKQADMALRAYVQTLCAPLWWESGGQTVVNSGSMCVVKTADALFGITNHHVLTIYEKHKAENADIFCQLGSAPFDPTANLISLSEHWDLATFEIPLETLKNLKHKILQPRSWPPAPIEKADHVVYGGYPESRRRVAPGPNPLTMTADFVSFRGQPNNCSAEHISFQVNPSELTWLPNVLEPLEPGANLSGMSGGPCFRLVPAENRIELAGIIYEGYWEDGIVFARQASLISATGQIAPRPL
jgi:hypothetical protein